MMEAIVELCEFDHNTPPRADRELIIARIRAALTLTLCNKKNADRWLREFLRELTSGSPNVVTLSNLDEALVAKIVSRLDEFETEILEEPIAGTMRWPKEWVTLSPQTRWQYTIKNILNDAHHH